MSNAAFKYAELTFSNDLNTSDQLDSDVHSAFELYLKVTL